MTTSDAWSAKRYRAAGPPGADDDEVESGPGFDGTVDATGALVAKYDEAPVPRGTSGRWEVVLADEEHDHGQRRLTALDVKGEHRILQELGDEDLAGIPLLPEESELRRYAEYLDLHDPARANFLAEGHESVRPGQRVVARKSVSKAVWDDLIDACDQITGRRRRTA